MAFNSYSTSIMDTKVSNLPFKARRSARIPFVEIAREEQTWPLKPLSDSAPCLSSPHLSFLIPHLSSHNLTPLLHLPLHTTCTSPHTSTPTSPPSEAD